jgi:hypothetical protein
VRAKYIKNSEKNTQSWPSPLGHISERKFVVVFLQVFTEEIFFLIVMEKVSVKIMKKG